MAGTTGAGEGSYAQQYADQVKFAVIIVSTVPVLCIIPVYPEIFREGGYDRSREGLEIGKFLSQACKFRDFRHII